MVIRRRMRRQGGRARKRLRRAVSRRVPRGMSMPLISLRRTFWVETWAPSATTTNSFWRYYAPSINALPSLSEFTALFDQYKINGVKLTLCPKFDSYAGNDNTSTSTNRSSSQVHWIVDPMSNVAPSGTYSSATFNTFCENGTVRSATGLRPVNIFWKPRIAATNQAVSDAQRTTPRFLSLANATTVLHNGVHVFIQDSNFSNNQTQQYDVFLTFYMQFKGIK